jgi:hypothetical protein
MKALTQKGIKKALIKIINNNKIDEISCEPRYLEGYEFQRILIGSIITIRTSIEKGRK